MSTFRSTLLIVALFILGLVTACEMAHPVRTLRYELTLNVMDHGVVKSGHGVVEFAYPSRYELFQAQGGYLSPVEMTGHPITVDLGPDGLLFVINRNSEKTYMRTSPKEMGEQHYAFPNLAGLPIVLYRLRANDWRRSREDIIDALEQEPREVIDVPVRYLPALMRFRNIAFANSIEEIDPDNLADTFGPGVYLESATLQLTDDPVTPAPEIWPDWLKNPDPCVGIDLRYGPRGTGHEIMNATGFANGQRQVCVRKILELAKSTYTQRPPKEPAR